MSRDPSVDDMFQAASSRCWSLMEGTGGSEIVLSTSWCRHGEAVALAGVRAVPATIGICFVSRG